MRFSSKRRLIPLPLRGRVRERAGGDRSTFALTPALSRRERRQEVLCWRGREKCGGRNTTLLLHLDQNRRPEVIVGIAHALGGRAADEDPPAVAHHRFGALASRQV